MLEGAQSIGKTNWRYGDKCDKHSHSEPINAAHATILGNPMTKNDVEYKQGAVGESEDVPKWLRFYESFWNERFDTLDALLKAEDAAAAQSAKKGESS